MPPVISRRLAVALVALALVGAACGDKMHDNPGPNPDAALRLSSPVTGAEVHGDVVTLNVSPVEVRIVKADGDTSGMTAHYHVFIDRPPVDPGKLIPKGPGIVHTVESPIRLTGLTPGVHQIFVVLGDGTHRRLGRSVVHTSVHVDGPSVQITGPPTAKVGDPVEVHLKAEGISIVKANGDSSGRTGHFHLLIDQPLPAAGEPIPKTDAIIHTADTTVALPPFTTPDEHTVWVVVGDGNHVPLAPSVIDKLAITVAPA